MPFISRCVISKGTVTSPSADMWIAGGSYMIAPRPPTPKAERTRAGVESRIAHFYIASPNLPSGSSWQLQRFCPFEGVVALWQVHRSWNRPRDLVFDHSRIIRMRLSSPGSSEPKSLVETNRGFVMARNHQLQDPGIATSGPVEDLLHQSTTDSPLAMCWSRPRADELGARRCIF